MGNDVNNSNSNMHINLSADGQKIKYYESDDDMCVFEILDDNSKFSNIDNNRINNNRDIDTPKYNFMKSVNNLPERNFNLIEDGEELFNKECDLLNENDIIDNCDLLKKDNDYKESTQKQKSFYENYESDIQKYHTLNKSKDNDFNYYNNPNYYNDFNYYDDECTDVDGKIIVLASINCDGKNKCLEGAKINLYRLNGVCPQFVESYLTDRQGKVEFKNLSEGCYRIIEIVNKNYFEKPKYIDWNEVNINKENTEAKVLVMNKLKKKCRRNFRCREY
ncbi:hypothetical protein BGI42_03615 [Clostridium taeniosporum]|uniref:SpaA-like prealbumin fold domain-containing protein n=2 Tax=Clostridium taeniosporum TaxID=394958 RepID=A0A1D7XHN2_9CLOT|nr:hypothetical protein BGI42_03615 [Clostridium taeniosporum]